MKVSQLKLNPNNPRHIKGERLEMLKRSISEFEQMMVLRPIIVDENNVVLGGNMRLQAIKALGKKEIPNEWVKRAVELTEEQKREFVIKDNAGFGEWDWELLANEWDDLPLADWGVDVPNFELIEDAPGTADAEPQIDRAAELNEKWQGKTGDLWQIGEHRLLCGDSTSSADVARVMDGKTADICFTSPPYNAGDSERLSNNTHTTDTKYPGQYHDDLSADDYLQFLNGFTEAVMSASRYVFVNIQPLAGNKVALIDYLSCQREHFADIAIWQKQTAAPLLAPRVMNSQFEFIVVLSPEVYPSRAIGAREFRGNVSNVHQDVPQRNNEFASVHAATFPVHLPTWAITNFTESGHRVLEPFAGSGTTLVACQNLNRKCYAIEISPNYCAVILERMQTAFPDLEIKRIEQRQTESTN